MDKQVTNSELINRIYQTIFEVLEVQEIDENIPIRCVPVDSIQFIRIMIKFEIDFHIQFSDDDLIFGKYNTIGDLVCYVKWKINAIDSFHN